MTLNWQNKFWIARKKIRSEQNFCEFKLHIKMATRITISTECDGIEWVEVATFTMFGGEYEWFNMAHQKRELIEYLKGKTSWTYMEFRFDGFPCGLTKILRDFCNACPCCTYFKVKTMFLVEESYSFLPQTLKDLKFYVGEAHDDSATKFLEFVNKLPLITSLVSPLISTLTSENLRILKRLDEHDENTIYFKELE